MGEEDHYELVARDDLAKLREELDEVKKDPTSSYQSSLTLIEAMDRLASQISRLLDLFEHANKEMHQDYTQGLHKESDKLDKVIEQNEKLARGILALADKHAPKPQTTPKPAPEPQQSTQPTNEQTPNYPLRGPEELSTAPWESRDDLKSPARRSLMREFK